MIEFFCGKDSRVKYLYTEKNLGQSKNTNQGLKYVIEHFDSPYVKIFHSDDILHPRCLEIEYETLVNTQTRVLFHDILPFDTELPEFGEDVLTFLEPPRNIVREWLNIKTPIPSGLSFESVFLKKGFMLNEDLNFLCDWEFFFDLILNEHSCKRLLTHLTAGLVGWRMHADSTSGKLYEDHFKEHIKTMDKYSANEKVVTMFDTTELKQWLCKGEKYRNDKYERDKVQIR